MSGRFKIDEIGYWSEIKLEIIREYAQAYSVILAARKFQHVYIDAFAGAGMHVTKRDGAFVLGSPLNAFRIKPPFCEYHLIDIEAAKVASLRRLLRPRADVFLYEGDCNRILLEQVFPRIRFEDYRRGLCVLDPYGLHLNWDVIRGAGHLGTLEIFLNFPVADMNRNVLWRNPERVDKVQIERMNAFWGMSRGARSRIGQTQLYSVNPRRSQATSLRRRFESGLSMLENSQ